MVSLKLWLKKLLFNKKKSVLLLLFIVLPLVLVCSMTLNFLNGYFIAFEDYSYQNIGSDIRVYSKYDNFQKITNKLKTELNNHPYIGFKAEFPFLLEINLTIFNLVQNISSIYINHPMGFMGLNFSGNTVKNFYIDTYIPLSSGRLPQNINETIVPTEYKEVYNISINSLINLHYKNQINQNITIVGFYSSKQNCYFSPKNLFIFFLNDLNNQLFQEYKDIREQIIYDIYLDHRQMDIFNIYSFTSELTQIESIIRGLFLNHIDSNDDVSSSSSAYQTDEFDEYITNRFYDFLSIIVPILLIIIIFSTMPSDYISNVERDYWHKAKVYTSEKSIKKQLFLEVLLNVCIAFSMALPLGIGLYIILHQISILRFSEFNLYLPNSYFILTSSFSVFFAFVIYIFIIRVYKKERTSNTKQTELRPKKLLKKSKGIIIFLGLLISLPLIERILYFGLKSFYNPGLTSIINFLSAIVNILSLFYPTIFILLIIASIPRLIIKFIQFIIKRIRFTKGTSTKFELMLKLFHFKRKSTLLLITILSLQLGFINFYNFKNASQFSQKELEVYLNYGSDFKLYESYSNTSLVNLSIYEKNLQCCQIKSISGRISNNTIVDSNVALLSFNPSNYTSTLNQRALVRLSPELISQINNLEDNEILVPVYMQYRYNLEIRDYLAIQPKNTTNLNYDYVETYEQSMSIKGFFDFVPGLDQDKNFFPSLYFQRRMIFIVKPDYNYSTPFHNLPIKRTYLIKDLNNSLTLIKSIVHNNMDLHYVSLQDGLEELNESYLAISNQSTINMFTIFTVLFLILSFLFIYNFINENSELWNLFQLFGQKESEIRMFIFKSLFGIFFISFLIGLFGNLTGFLIFLFENLKFKFFYYFYPISFHFDLMGLIFNILYLLMVVIIMWLMVYKIMKFSLNYKDLKKYNPE